MGSFPFLNKQVPKNELSTPIRVRAFRESDTPRIQEVYEQAMLYGQNSPAAEAQRSQLRKPLALILYSVFALGTLLIYHPRTRIAGALLSIVSSTSFVAWKTILWLKFKDFVQDAVKEDLSDLKKHYGAKPGGFWVAEVTKEKETGLIVGCVGLDSTVDENQSTAEIKRMVVHPMYQGQGVGRLLMTTLLEHAKENNLGTLSLTTSMFQPGAMRMYERLGFTCVKLVWVTIGFLSFTVDRASMHFYELDLRSEEDLNNSTE